MYYKVIKNNKVIDVLDNLVYLKYQKKHNRMILCNELEAQAFFSSDREHIWRTEGLYELPVEGYDIVSLVEIDKYEYEQLRVLNMKSPESIIDEYNLLLLELGVI